MGSKKATIENRKEVCAFVKDAILQGTKAQCDYPIKCNDLHCSSMKSRQGVVALYFYSTGIGIEFLSFNLLTSRVHYV